MRKAKTRQEIAGEYGVHPKTLLRWLKKAGIELPPGLISPIDQKRIYGKFGWPENVLKKPAKGWAVEFVAA